MVRRKKLLERAKSMLPIAKWLPTYNFKDDLVKDAIGGLTVGIMHIPQGMAYATLANLQPVNGLYTSFFAPLIYMFFGTSRHVSLGVFAVVSLIAGSCNVRVSEELLNKNGSIYESLAMDDISLRISTSLTLLSGLIGIALALMRCDFLLSFLSDHVIKGFTTGAAFHVFVAQLNKIMGVKLPRKSGPGKLFQMLSELGRSGITGDINYITVGISLFTIILLYSCKEYLNPIIKKRLKTIPIPYDLILMVIGVLLSSLFNISERFGTQIVGFIPKGLPIPEVPDVTIFPYIIKDAISVILVSLVVTISMGKLFAKKHHYDIDTRQEFYAIGLCGTLGSFFPIWPPSTALARTLVYEAAGTRTQLATVFSCGLLLSVMLFLGPFLESLPVCLLSCIIIVALKGMFMQMKEIPQLWKVSKLDSLTFVVTTAATIVFDVVEGLLAGILFSLLVIIYRAQRMSPTVTTKTDHEKGIDLCIKLDSSLFYLNADKTISRTEKLITKHFSTRSRHPSLCEEKAESCPLVYRKIVAIDLASLNFIDHSGITCLLEIVNNQRKLNIEVVFLNVPEGIRKTIEKHPDHKEILT